MRDFARCADITCPMREGCLRFTMLPESDGWQTYTQGRRQTDTHCLDFVKDSKAKLPKQNSKAKVEEKPKVDKQPPIDHIIAAACMM